MYCNINTKMSEAIRTECFNAYGFIKKYILAAEKCLRGRVAALCVIDTYANGVHAFRVSPQFNTFQIVLPQTGT